MTEIPILCRVKALYSFQSNDPSSLSFNQDDSIDVLNKLPSGWWDGLCNGSRGWFPSNYVQEVFEQSTTKNSEYRLSLAYNLDKEQSDHWNNKRKDSFQYSVYSPNLKSAHPTQQEGFDSNSIYEGQNSPYDLNWDQSTLNYSDEKPQPSPGLSQNTKFYYNDSQSIASSIGSSIYSNQPPQLLPRSPSRKPSVRVMFDSSEPLSWSTISSQIATTIYQLTTAAKNNQTQFYTKYASDIVNAIRFMLIASSTIDKESTWIKSNATLRSHHRAMMANMSKLILTSQTSQSIFINEDDQQLYVSKLLSECSELLLTIRNLINTCQTLKIPLVHPDPRWVEDQNKQEGASSSLQKTRYTVQLSLAETLDTLGTCVQDTAETLVKSISAYLSQADKADRKALGNVLYNHFRNLLDQTLQFFNLLDEIDFSPVQGFSEYHDLQRAKQFLSDTLGLLFSKVRDLTNERLPGFREALHQAEGAATSLFEPIECICESFLQLAHKTKSRSNSTASFLLSTSSLDLTHVDIEEDEAISLIKTHSIHPIERHKSELRVSTHSNLPYPIQRAHTAPLDPTEQKLKRFFGNEGPLPTDLATPKTPDEQPDYLKSEYGEDDILLTAEGAVRGGTLPALVERLTLHNYLDMNFINNFLLTYRSFCSSEKLLDLLEARYNLSCPDGLSDEDSFIWEEKKLKLVRLRVFNVLKNWLDLYFNEDDIVLLDRLLTFTQDHIKPTLKFSNGQLESLIEHRRTSNADGGFKKMILTLPDPPEPIYPKNRTRFKLLEVDPLEIARQLTIMDFKLYSAIRPIECLDKAWSKDDDQIAVNIRASIEYCNQVTSWVSDVILSQHDIKKRSLLIKYWVQVAEKCRGLNNFNTCMAILSAFDNSSVGRLKRTWEVVGARTTQTLQSIRKLMGANKNFVEYRQLIHSINPPCIPFLGIYLQDLTFIEDGNANELKTNKNMINFAKRAKTAEVVREIQQYQSSLYPLKPVKEIQEFIQSYLKSTRDEDQLYNESLKLEPRERDDEKITRLLQESGFL